MDSFVEALLAELERHAKRWEIRPHTIYFGGGTPTLLGQKWLEKLLVGIRERTILDDLKEWTMEANPKTFDEAKAALMRSAGVSRASLGVQSFQPSHLKTLGRDHSPAEAEASYEVLMEAGFPVVNVDLMFSLPNQSLADWERDLEKALSLQPKHISAYNLTYEEDTDFFEKFSAGQFRDDSDTNADHFYRADSLLTQAGFRHYEISNYALPGCESLHNQAYWHGADYLGLGPSAVSTVGNERWKNVPDTGRYTALSGCDSQRVERERLLGRDRHNERVALLLRTDEGLPEKILDPSLVEQALHLIDEGLLEKLRGRYRLVSTSRALVDPIASELML